MIDNPDYSSSTIRLLAYQALKAYSVTALHALLDDLDCIVRSAAARELQIRGDRETLEFVRNLLHDSRSYVREIVAFVLGQLGTPSFAFRAESLPLLAILATDESDEVRATAVAGLGHLRASEETEILIRAALDVAPDVRASAAVALGSVAPTPQVIQTVRTLLRDPDAEVRSWAESTLEDLPH